MANRVFYAVQAVGIAPFQTNSFVSVHGLQSVGITTTFNLEQVFELGMLAIYENIENVPDIEVTLEKVIDGYPLLFHLCTRGAGAGSSLITRSAKRCQVAMNIYDDVQDAASGTQTAQVDMSGMYLSSITYTIPTDGNCTESVTLVGNDKSWRTGTFTYSPTTEFVNDVPRALTMSSGGIQRRENVLFSAGNTLLPSGSDGIPGIASYGQNVETNGVLGAHITSITVKADLGRDSINELGRKGPYFRFVNWPVEVTTDIEVITTTGDRIAAGENTTLSNQRIIVALQDSTRIDLGSGNKLKSVTYGGGDAGGGNATVTYSYSGFNYLLVTHSQDPG